MEHIHALPVGIISLGLVLSIALCLRIEPLFTLQLESFSSNEQFIVSMKESFESFINVRQNKPAELVRNNNLK